MTEKPNSRDGLFWPQHSFLVAGGVWLTILIQFMQPIMLHCSFHSLCLDHLMWPFMDKYVPSVTVIYLYLWWTYLNCVAATFFYAGVIKRCITKWNIFVHPARNRIKTQSKQSLKDLWIIFDVEAEVSGLGLTWSLLRWTWGLKSDF